MNTSVYAAMWNVRKGGVGFEVFATRALAIDAVISSAKEVELLTASGMTEAAAREKLEACNSLRFVERECWYEIKECPVSLAGESASCRETKAGPQDKAERRVQVERLAAISTAHLSEAGRAWMEGGMQGAVGHPNEYGGFMYTGAEWCFSETEVPEEVRAIALWAKTEDLAWVKFDGDGQTVPFLAVFD